MPLFRFTEQQGVIEDGTAEQSVIDSAAAASTCVTYTAAGAISPTGIAVLKAGSGAAMTLVIPPAGASITIVAADAFAYTVTTPANKINGNADTATWTAAIGNSIQLASAAGVWYQVRLTGVALTEV